MIFLFRRCERTENNAFLIGFVTWVNDPNNKSAAKTMLLFQDVGHPI